MKKLILLIIILALSLGLFATEMQIGTGTYTRRFPLGYWWGYECSAALYNAAEIGTQSISISTVAWYSTIATTVPVPTKIYLKTTSDNDLTTGAWGNMISGATLLFDQTRTGTVAGGWNTFTLGSSFALAQGENLIVLVERNYGGTGVPFSPDGGGIRSTGIYGKHICWQENNTFPSDGGSENSLRPNVKLSYTVTSSLDELDIGTGTSTQRFPLGSYYGYERSAALYTADEIGAENISISNVAWYATISTTAAVPTKIYLKRTSDSTLTTSTWANMISGASLRYNQTKTGTGANGWNVYRLNSPFDLGMGENLIVMVETNVGGNGSDSAAGGTTSGAGIHSTLIYDTHLTWWASNNPPTGNNNNTPGLRPNVKLYYTYNDITPISLPFTEEWTYNNLPTNLWTKESENWGTISNLGSPAPSASFNWSPQAQNYSSALTSHDFDARGMSSVEFSFDLFLDNDGTDAENKMTWQIWNGSTWHTLGSYSSLDDDLPWTNYSYDVSTYAANRIFKIRYLASGEETYYLNKWLIDNIYLGAPAGGLGPVTNLVITKTANGVLLHGNSVAGATWYRVYYSEDPEGPFVRLGTANTTIAAIEVDMTGTYWNKYFYTMTAGNGHIPSGPRLDNASVSSPNVISQPGLRTPALKRQ
ncbi:MAG: hypothetical protein LHW41_07870 [Candidatus Cloacimonetes bacterium]|nr:hypothetical protein [Candidatus Cloacimonadota bacterium]